MPSCGDAGDMVLFRGAAHRVAVAVAHAVADVDEIQMGVDLHDVDRAAAREGADAGDVDRMVAAQVTAGRPRPGSRARRSRCWRGSFGVGMDDVGVADVDDADLGRPQVGHVVLVVIGPGVAEGEQGGRLADRPWPEAGSGAELGAEVEGRAQDRGIGVDRRPSRPT
jgi:hypothetical protein